MEDKKCTECGDIKKLEAFNKSNKSKDGRRQKCRLCEKAYRERPEVKQQRYERDLFNKYGITIKEYNEMFEEQEGCCKVCNSHQMNFNTSLAVDHNHKTGEVRGLLCSSCNTALGLLGDNPVVVESALNYLKENGYYGT